MSKPFLPAIPPFVRVALAVAIAASLGIAAISTKGLLMVALVGAIPAAWVMVRRPNLTLVLFWLVYSLRTTLFAGAESTAGLFYPLYVVMLMNALGAWRHGEGRLRVPTSTLVCHLCFLGVVMLSLLWQPSGLAVDETQRLFIYGIGLLAALQVQTEDQRASLYAAFAVTGLIVAIWTVVTAWGSSFAYRAGVNVNQNYVATIVNVGMVVLFDYLFGPRKRPAAIRILCAAGLLLGVYADLLLASRGSMLALLAAFTLMLVRRGSRKWTGLVLVAIGGAILALLPGANGLLSRFADGDMGSLNNRLPLWNAGLHQYAGSSVWEIVFGRGMGASENVVRAVNPVLTSMHNGFIQILLEFGLLGLGLFLTQLYLSIHYSRTGRSGNISLGLIVFMVVAALSATMQDGFLFWVVLGATYPRLDPQPEVQ